MDQRDSGRQPKTGPKPASGGVSRRHFLRISAATSVVAVVGCGDREGEEEAYKGPVMPREENLDVSNLKHPPSKGYLVVDGGKCQGCLTCMLSCSLAHEGKENLSLSRIQVRQNPFGKYPDDLTIEQCRQCVDPPCVEQCPTGALQVDAKKGNVPVVDEEKCAGCLSCVGACPHEPGRMIWNFEKKVAQKCDLCADTPYWKEKGGADGKQLCVEACPVGAITLVRHVPRQKGDQGYNVNLRGPSWKKLGYAVD